MESNQLTMTAFSVAQLVEEIRKAVASEVYKLKAEQGEKLISPAEACKLFNPPITKPTLTSWTNEGILQDYRYNRRVFYKASEILKATQTVKRYKKIY